MKVEVKNLCKSYGATKAASDVSFTFESGKIYGFIGPNGAGKTTTIKIIATLETADSGDVFFDGVSVTDYPEKARSIMGYMPDSLPDFSDIQIWEYLDFYARCFGLRGEKRCKMLREIEEFTNLSNIRTKYLGSLSKGLKQRVSLARALIHDPKILLLDEPAAGLDPRARMELRNLLKILAEQGKAILLSSHILSELQNIVDGAIIIEKGHVLAAGTIDELTDVGMGKNDSEVSSSESAKPNSIHVIVKCMRESERVLKALREDPMVLSAEIVTNNEILAVISGNDDDVSAVVKRLFLADMPIIGFDKRYTELEEIFMNMTQGTVQ